MNIILTPPVAYDVVQRVGYDGSWSQLAQGALEVPVIGIPLNLERPNRLVAGIRG